MSEITYTNPFSAPFTPPPPPPFPAPTDWTSWVTYLEGIKSFDDGAYLLTGGLNTTQGLGLIYTGLIDDVSNPDGSTGSGTWSVIDIPVTLAEAGANGISIYGPDHLGNGKVNLVGACSMKPGSQGMNGSPVTTLGFVYQGTIEDAAKRGAPGYVGVQGKTKAGAWASFTFMHSVSHGLAAGNCDAPELSPGDAVPSIASTAFLFDLATSDQTIIEYQHPADKDLTHTAYGIWHNGDDKYTIAGGSGLPKRFREPAGSAYLIDYDKTTRKFSNYTQFNYSGPKGKENFLTHFEGIWSDNNGLYKMPATSTDLTSSPKPTIASIVTVKRNPSGGFDEHASWEDLDLNSAVTTANSTSGNVTVGFITSPRKQSYVAIQT